MVGILSLCCLHDIYVGVFVVEVEVLDCAQEDLSNVDFSEPLIPSLCAQRGLEGSYVGRGAWGIRS